MSIEEKFRAAVNVIRSLPKNGSYQPSHELMLRFYGYFKQASEGPCNQARPSFWEVVKKMKWDAWNKLGNMSKEEAMSNYVAELTKIVETMSYTDNVASFMGSLGSFYETVPMEDLELLLGNVIERVRSQPGSPLSTSPFGSREASPQRLIEQATLNGRNHVTSSLETSPASSYSVSPLPPDLDDDEDDDEFIDTVEHTPSSAPERIIQVASKKTANGHSLMNGHTDDQGGERSERGRPRERNSPLLPRARNNQGGDDNKAQHSKGDSRVVDISEHIKETVLHLQRDLDRITSRVRSLEVSAMSNSTSLTPKTQRSRTSWWPFSDVSPRTLSFLVVWPFITHFIIVYLQRRQKKPFS